MIKVLEGPINCLRNSKKRQSNLIKLPDPRRREANRNSSSIHVYAIYRTLEIRSTKVYADE